MPRFGPILIPLALALGLAGVAGAPNGPSPAAPSPLPAAAPMQVVPATSSPPADSMEGPWGSKIEPVDAKTPPSARPLAQAAARRQAGRRRH